MSRKPITNNRTAKQTALDEYNVQMSSKLGRQVVDAMDLLVKALSKASIRNPSDSRSSQAKSLESYTASDIYDSLRTSIIRMVVLLFAEERGLLPIHIPLYAQRYSLMYLAETLENDTHYERKAFASLLGMWKGIYYGIEEEGISLFPHKGELFHPQKTPIFHDDMKLDISNEELLSILQKLRYVDGEKVCYQNLYIEQVGSLYELLMELHIEWEGSSIVLKGANLRKDTGAHYTPRYLCDFIVEDSLARSLSSSATSHAILSLRICDPAMGSGAFLMSACRYLGQKLYESWAQEKHPSASKENPLELARVCIAENCLYGVDVNPDAVLLTTMSLWLESGAKNRDFEFLEHRLRHGNGVVGFSNHRNMNAFFSDNEDTAIFLEHLSTQEPSVREDVYNLFVAAFQKVTDKKLGKRATQSLYRHVQREVQRLLEGAKDWRREALPKDLHILLTKLSTKPLYWELAFSSVFSEEGGFDVVLGNPPFINCIRGNISRFQKLFLKKRFSYISGSADLSYYFLELASELIRDDGVIGLILPRVSMGADALRAFRVSETLPKPCVMYSAEHYRFFAHANIKVVVYIFSASQKLWVSNSDMPMNAQWVEASIEDKHWWPSFQGNWWAHFWLALQRKEIPNSDGFSSVVELGFEVRGGLTTGDFYNINVEDSSSGTGLRLLTSGGIDPNVSYWGDEKLRQRFNKKRYRFPRIIPQDYDKGLQKKLKRSIRPKLIIANLTKEMEIFLDEKGEYQAATGTQTVYHCHDDVQKLKLLQTVLHSTYGNLLFHSMLSYNAMHSNISVEKRFLENFPVQKNDFLSNKKPIPS